MQIFRKMMVVTVFIFVGLFLFFLSYEVLEEKIFSSAQVGNVVVDLDELPEGALPVKDMDFIEVDLAKMADDEEGFLETAVEILPELNMRVHVDLAEQKLCIEAYGNMCAKEFPVSTGASDTPTPTGEFKVYFKQPLRISGGEERYRMPNYMSLAENGAFGFHSLPYLGSSDTGSAFWHEARWHIGVPVSHGCIRMLPEHSDEFYSIVPVGTPVLIN